MTRKRVGQGLLESFSETCEACGGRGVIVHGAPVDAPARSERFDDRQPVDRKRAAAELARVAAAAAATKEPAPEQDAADDEPGSAAPAGRGRRRRGGRSAGAASGRTDAVGGATDRDGEADGSQADGSQADASQADGSGAVGGDADVPELAAAPSADLLPELSDQPTPDMEDVPVLPTGLAGATEPGSEADAGAGSDQAERRADLDPSRVDPEPVDLELEPEPEAAPEAVLLDQAGEDPVGLDGPVLDPLAPPLELHVSPVAAEPAIEEPPTAEPQPAGAPRRRRRATSRPAGPPAAS